MGFATTFLYSQLFVKLPFPTYDFSGQTIIITGANTGLGFEAARHITRLNAAKVILAVRSVPKGEAAAASISSALNVSPSRIEVWQVDLSDYASIKAFLKRVNALDRLDAVIQNAGILTTNFTVAEGHESTVTINIIGALLLGLGALPKLRESAAQSGLTGRLAFVGSDLQYIAKFQEKSAEGRIFDALDIREGADMDDRYKVSKLLLLYAVRVAAAQSPISTASNVLITYLTPGACVSDIFRDDSSWPERLVRRVAFGLIARTTEQGSRALVHAVSPHVADEKGDGGRGTHGAFLMDCQVFPNGDNVESPTGVAMQKRTTQELWAILEEIEPGVTKF